MKKILLTMLLALSIMIPIHASADQQFFFLRYREHATDCKSLVDGGYYDICRQLSDNNWYACYPTAGVNGTCTTPGEWQLIVANAGTWGIFNGNTYTTDFNSNVGIGTNTPSDKLQVIGVISSNQDITVDGDSVCRKSGANCPTPIFFDPANYGPAQFGSGSTYDWTHNSGATKPIMRFSDGLISFVNSGLKVFGTVSGVKFGNKMFLRGNTGRKICLGSTEGTYNNSVCADNDTYNHKIYVTSDNGVTSIDTDLIAIKNTSTINNFGGVTIGTAGTGASVATITGNVAIGTSNFNTVAPANGVVSQGDIYVNTIGKGFVYKKPDGSCCRSTADNSNNLTCAAITCP
jgi:hypothetical protein